MTRNPESDDDFWKIALHNDTERIDVDTSNNNDDEVNDENGNDGESTGDYHHNHHHNNQIEPHMYALNIPPYGSIHLNLIPLSVVAYSNHNNVMIPLGAEAWYGSALLAALLIEGVWIGTTGRTSERTATTTTTATTNSNSTNSSSTGTRRLLQTCLSSYIQRGNYNITILELGSGAVGLAGVVAGLSVTGYMHCYDQQQQQQRNGTTLSFQQNFNPTLATNMECRVILTDSEPHVLQQLEYNVHVTAQKLQNLYSNQYAIPEFVVRHLDWDNIHGYPNISTGDHCNGLQLVIGSELVYNVATGRSCAATVRQLLQTNPHVLVIIVNNMNRDGWETFVSTMDRTPGICYELDALNSSRTHVHTVASNLVRPGGTLNPLSDFCACCLWND